jgi:hypothetical protein
VDDPLSGKLIGGDPGIVQAIEPLYGPDIRVLDVAVRRCCMVNLHEPVPAPGTVILAT